MLMANEPDIREMQLHAEIAGVTVHLGTAKVRLEDGAYVELIDYIPSKTLDEQEEENEIHSHLVPGVSDVAQGEDRAD